MRSQFGIELVDHMGDPQFLGFVDGGGKRLPEIAQQRFPFHIAVRDVVEAVFQVGGKAVLDIAFEELRQKSDHHAPAIVRREAALFQHDVIAVLQHLQNGCIGRRTPDTQLFHLADKAGFGIARRRLGEMLFRRHRTAGHRIPFGHRRQDAVAVVAVCFVVVDRRGAFVLAFLIQLQEAVEFHYGAVGAQHGVPVGGGNVDRDLFHYRRFHLAGDSAFPDQVVQLALVLTEILAHLVRPAAEICGAHGFMRFLRVLGFVAIGVGRIRNVFVAVILTDRGPNGDDGFLRHVHAVRPHVGDQPDGLAPDIDTLVQFLRGAHGPGRPEAEFARGFLLHGRCGEWGSRTAIDRFSLDRFDLVIVALDLRDGGLGRIFVCDVVAFQLLAVQVREAGRHLLAVGGRVFGADRPVFLRFEDFDLGFALADQPQRDRLHAPGGAGTRQLAPQYRRQAESDQIVQRAARQVGIDQFLIQFARIGQCLDDGVLGDLVENDAFDVDAVQRFALVEDFLHVPGDRLALAVRVGCEIKVFGTLDGVLNGLNVLLGTGVHRPDHSKVVIGLNGAVLGHKVPHVSHARENLVVRAQILVDGFCLGRRFNDDDVHGHRKFCLRSTHPSDGWLPECLQNQRHPVSQMTLDPARKLQFQQDVFDRGGRHVALANQFVNTCWRRTQKFYDLVMSRNKIDFRF